MNIIDAILLGLVQGLTEFIPISSSAHLILVREWFGVVGDYDLAVDAVLQLATVGAVAVYFRKDLWRLCITVFRYSHASIEERILFKAIVIGTIPAIVIGLLLESYMETVFRNTSLIALTLIIGSLIMAGATHYSRKHMSTDLDISKKDLSSSQIPRLTLFKSLIVGLFQSLALIPGMSRAGMTISGGLFMGLSQDFATRFSFLLAFPIILGSGMKKALELFSDTTYIDPNLYLAIFIAFVSGLCAIHFLVTYLRKGSLMPFVWYRLALALVIFLFV